MTINLNATVGLDRYPIIIGSDIYKELDSFLSLYSEDSIFVISDNFFKESSNAFFHRITRFKHIFIDGGIESKSITSYQKIIDLIVQNQIPKDGVVVAIGGGVIGDLVAFVANTYQRGIDLILVPTTTTAMIDSSVGGKTGINYLDQVNLIGSYHNPKAIFMEMGFLSTLNIRDYYAGICEAIKMSITSDREMFNRLYDISNNLNNRDIKTLEEIICWSVKTKLKHVSEDQREQSIRLLLNYGHTFGQTLETYYGLYSNTLRHGEAVALGITVAAKLSLLLDNNDNTNDVFNKTKEILERYNLPYKLRHLNTNDIPISNKLLDNLINDKKRLSKGNRFILCEKIGTASVRLINDKYKIYNAFEAIYN